MDLIGKHGLLPVYLSASPIEIEEWASCIALVVTDLSSRKRSEQVAAQFAVELPPGTVVDPVARTQFQSRPLRIGLVEDNAEVATALVYSLAAFEHQVIAAASGYDLLERLGQATPDIVVSDYRIAGGETGFQVITALCAVFGSAQPAFIVTGDTDPGLMSSMATQGVMVLHKPLELEALQIYLAQLTRGS
jgi:two-component system, sensor histidine kinase